MSLPRTQRLSSREVPFVFAKGRRKAYGGIVLFFLPNNKATSRLSVVVSSKIARKSTARNTIRRRTKEIIRALFPRLKKKYDFVVVFQKKKSSHKEIKHTIEHIFTSLNILLPS